MLVLIYYSHKNVGLHYKIEGNIFSTTNSNVGGREVETEPSSQ